ncbi:MAG TPA: ferrochelatase [Xanthomonadales bacterium]|nr:ferrochelatase [Xanthomonadales bacterium]
MDAPPTPDFPHERTDLTGVLVVNLGTPEAPTPGAVRRYLAEFLADPRVIEAPRALWWLILHGVILRIRPARSARKYAMVWTPDGSPLLVLTRELTARLARALDPDGERPLEVAYAMRYGEPSIPRVLRAMRARGLRRLLVLPLYPQYSGTTTGSVFDAIADELSRWRFVPELRFVQGYHDDEAWVAALAASVRAHWASTPRGERLLFSFHGIPQRYFDAGDPYFCACQASARKVAERLGLAASEWLVSFQSRVGREPWLRPYTDETLVRLAREGVRSVDVACPGFAVDCLETLEEIAIENRDAFLAAGGERYAYVPALNAGDDHVAALAALVARHGHGWDALAPSFDAARRREDAALRAERAAALRATRA